MAPATTTQSSQREAVEQILAGRDWHLYYHLTFRRPTDAIEAQRRVRDCLNGLAGQYRKPLVWAAAVAPNPQTDARHHAHGLIERPDTPALVPPSIVQSAWSHGYAKASYYDEKRAGRPESYIAQNAAQPDGHIIFSKSFRDSYSPAPEAKGPAARASARAGETFRGASEASKVADEQRTSR